METTDIRVIAPGLVLIKNALSKEQQISLCNYAVNLTSKDETGGFWIDLPSGERVLNSGEFRGRIYDALSKYPDSEKVENLCKKLVSEAQKKDSKLPSTDPTHLLLLYYANDQGMYWHTDSDENDGTKDHPVVSLSLGNACDFGVKIYGKKEEYIRLESGDCILFGGPQRMVSHCVQQVHMGTCPDYLPIKNVRLNFTFRDVPELLGKEEKWKYSVKPDNKNCEEIVKALTGSVINLNHT